MSEIAKLVLKTVGWLLALAAITLFLHVTSPAHAQEAVCTNPWAAAQQQADEYGYRQVELTGADKDRFVANYNAYPPASDDHPDHVWIAIKQGEDPLFAFVVNDCVTEAEEIEPEMLEKWLTEEPKLPGDPA